jgi:hypothetical protein
MALIDDTFGAIPAQILADWGIDITYIKTTTPRTYDPTTGTVTGADTNVTVKGVISRLSPRESEGLYQTTDIKVIIGSAELNGYYPTEADRIQYPQAGATREAKIISILTYRGDNPVYHTLIARPQ